MIESIFFRTNKKIKIKVRDKYKKIKIKIRDKYKKIKIKVRDKYKKIKIKVRDKYKKHIYFFLLIIVRDKYKKDFFINKICMEFGFWFSYSILVFLLISG